MRKSNHSLRNLFAGLIAAAPLALTGNLAHAGSWWTDVYQNPDLDSRVGPGSRQTFAPVMPSQVRISLYEFNRGNPEYSQLNTRGAEAMGSGGTLITSLDRFNRGNPDVHSGLNRGDV